jgi:hypothetical protein
MRRDSSRRRKLFRAKAISMCLSRATPFCSRLVTANIAFGAAFIAYSLARQRKINI